MAAPIAATRGGARPARNPAKTMTTTMPGLSRAAGLTSGMLVGTSARTSRRPARRQKNQSTSHARNSPTSATGPRCQRKSRYPMPEKDPTTMFCGFPVIVATLPMFESRGYGQEVGNRLESHPAARGEREGNHHETDDVIDEKCRKNTTKENDRGQQM